MAIVRYNPWQEMNSLQHQLNSLLDDTLSPKKWNSFGNLSGFPAAEITEKNDAFYLRLEVPGIEPKDIDIQVMKDRVAIAGERKSEFKSEDHGNTRLCGAVSFRTEFSYGKFQRVIPLPAHIQNTNVSADYKDGILSLTLPKSEEEKNKVVKVSLDPADS